MCPKGAKLQVYYKCTQYGANDFGHGNRSTQQGAKFSAVLKFENQFCWHPTMPINCVHHLLHGRIADSEYANKLMPQSTALNKANKHEIRY